MLDIPNIIHAVAADTKQIGILAPFRYCFSCGVCYKSAGTCFSDTREMSSEIADHYREQMPY